MSKILIKKPDGSLCFMEYCDAKDAGFEALNSATACYVPLTNSAASNLFIGMNACKQVGDVCNAPPVANPDTATTAGEAPVTIDVVANDTDADGDTLAVTAVTQGSNGSVAIISGKPVYTANAGFTGTDTFTYTISDGNGGTDTATVTVTVSEDVALVANPDTAFVYENTPLTIGVRLNDVQSTNLPFSVTSVTTPANGTVAIVGGTVTYTPTNGYVGADTFDYTITDSLGNTATSTVTLTVLADPAPEISTPRITKPDTGEIRDREDIQFDFQYTPPSGLTIASYNWSVNGTGHIVGGENTGSHVIVDHYNMDGIPYTLTCTITLSDGSTRTQSVDVDTPIYTDGYCGNYAGSQINTHADTMPFTHDQDWQDNEDHGHMSVIKLGQALCPDLYTPLTYKHVGYARRQDSISNWIVEVDMLDTPVDMHYAYTAQTHGNCSFQDLAPLTPPRPGYVISNTANTPPIEYRSGRWFPLFENTFTFDGCATVFGQQTVRPYLLPQNVTCSAETPIVCETQSTITESLIWESHIVEQSASARTLSTKGGTIAEDATAGTKLVISGNKSTQGAITATLEILDSNAYFTAKPQSNLSAPFDTLAGAIVSVNDSSPFVPLTHNIRVTFSSLERGFVEMKLHDVSSTDVLDFVATASGSTPVVANTGVDKTGSAQWSDIADTTFDINWTASSPSIFLSFLGTSRASLDSQTPIASHACCLADGVTTEYYDESGALLSVDSVYTTMPNGFCS